jgi:hypothetical protein
MKYPELLSNQEHEAGRVDNHQEQRVQPRFALLLRSAKLVNSRGEFLCIVRDVSESGVKLRLFHPVVKGEDLALEIATGERFGVEMVWEEEGEAGFQFVDTVDVMRFIAEAGPFPKRPVRIRVSHPAVLSFDGSTAEATICDLSRQGAKIETTQQRLAIGQTLRIEAHGLPQFEATVCWRRHPHYGLVFRQLMSMEELAVRVYDMQAPNADEA